MVELAGGRFARLDNWSRSSGFVAVMGIIETEEEEDSIDSTVSENGVLVEELIRHIIFYINSIA